MRNTILMFTAALTWQTAPLVGQGSNSAQSDSARIQGTWLMLSGENSGTPVPVELAREMRRVATGNEVIITWGPEVFLKARFTLNPGATPKQIDYQVIEGSSAGGIQLGIYSVVGDTARFCFAPAGAPRPTEFKTVSDDGRTLSTWIRRKR